MDIFAKCNKNLSSQRSIDVNLSGSTCVTAMVRGGRIYCCNLGDSRCVLARQEGGKFKAIGLSDDQKPERADERARIIKSGGRVAPLEDENGDAIGPQRVWLATMMMPGLAMTRSFGDHVAESVGVIPEPEIMDHVITPNDRFMVLASDGVWEFLDNQAVVDLVASCDGNGPEACKKVIKASYDAWMREEEVVDDITCVVVYFP
jgi:serine/threonine protein phosphatase PrpC